MQKAMSCSSFSFLLDSIKEQFLNICNIWEFDSFWLECVVCHFTKNNLNFILEIIWEKDYDIYFLEGIINFIIMKS